MACAFGWRVPTARPEVRGARPPIMPKILFYAGKTNRFKMSWRHVLKQPGVGANEIKNETDQNDFRYANKVVVF